MKPSGDWVRGFFSRRGWAPLGLVSAHCLGPFLTGLCCLPSLCWICRVEPLHPINPQRYLNRIQFVRMELKKTFPLTDAKSNIQILDSELALPRHTGNHMLLPTSSKMAALLSCRLNPAKQHRPNNVCQIQWNLQISESKTLFSWTTK